MIIIVEGANAVGKSTLVAELAAHPDLRDAAIIHKSAPTSKNLLDEYLLPLVRATREREHVICDRWHLGELVYPELLGRRSLANPYQFAYLEMWLRARGALLAWVTADPAAIANRHARRGEPVHDEALAEERRLFLKAAGRSNLPTLPVQTNDDRLTERELAEHVETPRELADRVALRACKVRDETRSLDRFTSYAGPPNPDVLLLGDKRGPGFPEYPCAFAPMSTTSGGYLFKSLPWSWLERQRVSVANVNEGDNPLELWKHLGLPGVVALGTEAWRGALRAGFTGLGDLGAVPHPQWVRRFKHSQGPSYGARIERAASTREDLRRWPTST